MGTAVIFFMLPKPSQILFPWLKEPLHKICLQSAKWLQKRRLKKDMTFNSTLFTSSYLVDHIYQILYRTINKRYLFKHFHIQTNNVPNVDLP